MPRYGQLLLPSANRVYSDAAVALSAAELAVFSDSVLGGALSAAVPTEIGGVPCLEFAADALSARQISFLANVSSMYALFELVDGLLRPVDLHRLDRYHDDLITIQKYQGKTNEQFTKLLLNVTLMASAFAGEMLDRKLAVLDPLCGAGTVLIERAQLGRYSLLIGGDHDPAALAAARENIGPRYKPIELHQWDAVALPLPDASVSKVVTNLPWGIRHGSHEENRRLYPRLIAEFKRVARKGGLIVMLTGETRLMGDLMTRGRFRPEKIVHVTILGAPAAVYVSRVV